jgi:Integrase core domain
MDELIKNADTNAMNDYFSKFYYDDKNIWQSPQRLWDVIREDMKKQSVKYTKQDLINWLKLQEQYQINRQNNKKINFQPIVAPYKTFMCDITYYIQFSRINGGYNAILTMVEITSRKAYAYPLKTKGAEEVLNQFKKLKEEVKEIKGIECDEGSEFVNKKFREWCETEKIKLITFNGELNKNSLGIVNRFHRTLRSIITKVFPNGKWVENLQKIIDAYNDTKHSATGYKPNEVTEEIAKKIRNEKIIDGLPSKEKMNEYQVGDSVRYFIPVLTFGKGSGSWSRTIHSIEKIEGNSFYLSEMGKRKFRYYELQKVDKNSAPPPASSDISKRITPEQFDELMKELNMHKTALKMNPDFKEIGTNLTDMKNLVEENLAKSDGVETRTEPERKSSRIAKEANLNAMAAKQTPAQLKKVFEESRRTLQGGLTHVAQETEKKTEKKTETKPEVKPMESTGVMTRSQARKASMI